MVSHSKTRNRNKNTLFHPAQASLNKLFFKESYKPTIRIFILLLLIALSLLGKN